MTRGAESRRRPYRSFSLVSSASPAAPWYVILLCPSPLAVSLTLRTLTPSSFMLLSIFTVSRGCYCSSSLSLFFASLRTPVTVWRMYERTLGSEFVVTMSGLCDTVSIEHELMYLLRITFGRTFTLDCYNIIQWTTILSKRIQIPSYCTCFSTAQLTL